MEEARLVGSNLSPFEFFAFHGGILGLLFRLCFGFSLFGEDVHHSVTA